MRELAKRLALASLGTAVVSTAKVRETLESLVHQGKLTTEEAERFTNDMSKTGEKEMQDIRNQITEIVELVTKGMNLAHAEDVDQLRHRVDNLEKRVMLLEDHLASAAGSRQPTGPEVDEPGPEGQ